MTHKNAITIKGSLQFIVFMSNKLLSLPDIEEDSGLIGDRKNPSDYVRVVRFKEHRGEDRF